MLSLSASRLCTKASASMSDVDVKNVCACACVEVCIKCVVATRMCDAIPKCTEDVFILQITLMSSLSCNSSEGLL